MISAEAKSYRDEIALILERIHELRGMAPFMWKLGLAAIEIDAIDHLKQIDEHYKHPAGDPPGEDSL